MIDNINKHITQQFMNDFSSAHNLVSKRLQVHKEMDQLIATMDGVRKLLNCQDVLSIEQCVVDVSCEYFKQLEDRYLQLVCRSNDINEQLEDLGYNAREQAQETI